MTGWMIWLTFVAAGSAFAFGYHAWRSWKTGIARFPLSLFVVEEFERDRNENFWPIVVLNSLLCAAALSALIALAWNGLTAVYTPIARVQALNGCYYFEGSIHLRAWQGVYSASRTASSSILTETGSRR